MPVRAVSFDVGNTLLRVDPSPGAVYARALSQLGVAVETSTVEQVFRTAWQRASHDVSAGEDRYRVGGGVRPFWRRIVHEVVSQLALKRQVDIDVLLDQLLEDFARPDSWHVFADVRPTLAALRNAGLRLGVTSNWDDRLPGLLESLGLSRWFDAITVSHSVGAEKPAAAPFDATARALGVAAGDLLHVGDSYADDVVGARNAGVHAVWIQRGHQQRSSQRSWIATLDALLTILGPDNHRTLEGTSLCSTQ